MKLKRFLFLVAAAFVATLGILTPIVQIIFGLSQSFPANSFRSWLFSFLLFQQMASSILLLLCIPLDPFINSHFWTRSPQSILGRLLEIITWFWGISGSAIVAIAFVVAGVQFLLGRLEEEFAIAVFGGSIFVLGGVLGFGLLARIVTRVEKWVGEEAIDSLFFLWGGVNFLGWILVLFMAWILGW
ncbi:MAG: hypothetical protein AB4290_26815 [Spirulina sp.]